MLHTQSRLGCRKVEHYHVPVIQNLEENEDRGEQNEKYPSDIVRPQSGPPMYSTQFGAAPTPASGKSSP